MLATNNLHFQVNFREKKLKSQQSYCKITQLPKHWCNI